MKRPCPLWDVYEVEPSGRERRRFGPYGRKEARRIALAAECAGPGGKFVCRERKETAR